MKKSVYVLSVLFFSLSISLSSSASKISVGDFAALADVWNVRLSHDGNSILYASRVEEEGKKGYFVNVLNLTTKKNEVVMFAEDSRFRLNWVKWASESKLFVSTSFPDVREGVRATETRLFILDLKTKKVRSAISERTMARFARNPQFQDNIFDLLIDDPNYFLLDMGGIYRVGLNKSQATLVHSPKPNVGEWIADADDNVRVSVVMNSDRVQVMHKFPDDLARKTLWKFKQFSSEEVWPIGFSNNPNHLYVSAYHDGRKAIFKVDLASENLSKELVYADDKYDVQGELFYSEKAGNAVGIELDEDRGYIFWEDGYKNLLDGINKGLPNRFNYIVSFSRDENRYVLFSSSDKDSGTYYVGDRKEKSLVPIAYKAKKLLPSLMQAKNKVSYKARDGLEIEAFLTLPATRNEGEGVPTVIFPHSWATGSVDDSFNSWTQMFAHSGYAVLQMNFRGSSGQGHEFLNAGLEEWGLSMQNDIADGARWMIKQGYSDPDKICIVGDNFGGYAALMGAAKSPDLYKCAISSSGISDLSAFLDSKMLFGGHDIWKKMIGSNKKSLKERSPITYAKSIDTPVLLIHGTEDRYVRFRQSKKMLKALKKHGKDVELLELEDGDYRWSRGDHRLEAFTAMDKFLKKHLKD